MKTIKNIVLSLLTVLMITSLLTYNVNAANNDSTNNNDQIFVQEIENDKEEKLSGTQQLNTVKIQALKELGYTEINKDNASEVLNRMAEIESRKV